MAGRAVARFTYRSETVIVEITGVAAPAFAFRCPCCRGRYRLNPVRHDSRVDKAGALTVDQLVRCPNTVLCGWAAQITHGLARDLEAVLDFGLRTRRPRESQKGRAILWRKRPQRELAAY